MHWKDLHDVLLFWIYALPVWVLSGSIYYVGQSLRRPFNLKQDKSFKHDLCILKEG